MQCRVHVEIAPGELIDKITILEIKRERIRDAEKQQHVVNELRQLTAICDRAIPTSGTIEELAQRLRSINQSLWDVEDALRIHERDQEFGSAFVELARSVYKMNDQRALVKREINELLGSTIREEKQYVSYSE